LQDRSIARDQHIHGRSAQSDAPFPITPFQRSAPCLTCLSFPRICCTNARAAEHVYSALNR
jgi:hypothetical protein